MRRTPQWKVVSFQNRFQSYFPDGSIIVKSKNTLTYYSTKGNKIRISKDTLRMSQEIKEKLESIANKFTILDDAYYTATLPDDDDDEKSRNKGGECFYKKYKIQEFLWEVGLVKQTKEGFQIKSDDGNVRVLLRKDLYKVDVWYPQRTGRRKVTQDGLFLNKKNRRRELIQKYGGKYTQYPQDLVNIEIEQQYKTLHKQFTIFVLPPRWCPPLKAIWRYILANKLIPHPFCYIDFEQPQNEYLRQIQTTKMPSVIPLLSPKQSQFSYQPQALPLYGKSNHNNKWKWLSIQPPQNPSHYFNAYYIEGGGCLISEPWGYWLLQDTDIIFSTCNKDTHEYKVAISVFPLTVRMEGQPARDIKGNVNAVVNYRNYRENICRYQGQEEVRENSGQSNSEEIIFQEQIQGIGHFKAYGNKVVVARFQDRTLITIHGQQIRIMGANGRSLVTFFHSTHPKQFRQHLKWLLDWYDRLFNQAEWSAKEAMNEELEHHIMSTKTFIEVSSHVKKMI